MFLPIRQVLQGGYMLLPVRQVLHGEFIVTCQESPAGWIYVGLLEVQILQVAVSTIGDIEWP